MLCEERLAEGDVKGDRIQKSSVEPSDREEAGMKHLMSVQLLEKVLYYSKVYCQGFPLIKRGRGDPDIFWFIHMRPSVKLVDFELIRREMFLGGSDLIKWRTLKERLGSPWYEKLFLSLFWRIKLPYCERSYRKGHVTRNHEWLRMTLSWQKEKNLQYYNCKEMNYASILRVFASIFISIVLDATWILTWWDPEAENPDRPWLNFWPIETMR